MDQLFSPWRFAYVSSPDKEADGCVFCRLADAGAADDAGNFILLRGKSHFLVLNIYPYTTGHLMIVPYAHRSRLADLTPDARAELFELAARAEGLLDEVYRPEGINLGMNLGRCSGAGIEGHLHLHAVPRWCGDTNFMTVTADTRVLPEDLHVTWRKLHDGL